MSKDHEIMVPTGKVTDEGYGHYEMRPSPSAAVSEAAPQQLEISVNHKKPGGIRRTAKTIGYVAAAGLVVAGALQIKDWVTGFSPKTKHKVDLAVGAPQTRIYNDVHLDLAGIDSTFPLTLRTSLDRPGPFNCDTETLQTGKKGQSPKITTHTDAGLTIDGLEVKNQNGTITATVNGDVRLSRSSVDYDKQTIDVKGASGGVDVCVGTHEITAARNIVDRTVQHAGGIAAACALESPLGVTAFKNGIAEFVTNTDLANGKPAEDIQVELPDFEQSAKAVYGEQVADFEQSLNKAINGYLHETDDHAQPRINDQALIDCSQHHISYGS